MHTDKVHTVHVIKIIITNCLRRPPPSPLLCAGVDGCGPEESAPKRRRVGPAAPSAELLAAAAAFHADIEAAGGYGNTDTAAEPGPEQDDGGLIGPPPPEFIDEADAAPADAREAAVIRVMRVLRDAAAADEPRPAAAAAAAAPAPDPYAVLGVEATADTAAIRKVYWRLSLLVHPDKCSHASAHEAFQAVSKAAKLLQDEAGRRAHDAAAEDAALRKAALAAAAAAERQAAWAAARGEALPPDVAAQLAAARAAAAGPAARESWMTDLPPEQRKSAASALAGLSQVGREVCGRGRGTGEGRKGAGSRQHVLCCCCTCRHTAKVCKGCLWGSGYAVCVSSTQAGSQCLTSSQQFLQH